MSRPKYNAKKTECGAGHVHDSGMEATRCTMLTAQEVAGVITHLAQQPQFWFSMNGVELKHENGRRVGYKADFSYRENGELVVEEYKGFVTSDWPLRKAVFRALFPHIELREIRGGAKRNSKIRKAKASC